MYKTFIISLSLLCGISSFGQLTPIYNIPSPEVAGLGEYGNTPVSLFTGTPDISIPLYEMKVGKYSLPITASYHTASVKPHTQPGPLGVGWSLLAGGYITRTVRFVYDEKTNTSAHEYGFYGHSSELKNMTRAGFQSHIANHLSPAAIISDNYYELSPDEFSFNFCGYTGNFYYNEDGGWTVVSDDDIKVEFDPNTGFMTWEEVNQRFHEHNWGNSSKNNRFFSKFTLVTPDGARYEFGGLNATEFSISYYGRQTSDLIATSWRLTKITTPDKRVINFTYTATQLMCDLRYIPNRITANYDYDISLSTSSFVRDVLQKGNAGFTGFLIFPVELVKIESVNDVIDFTYNIDSNHNNRHFMNTQAVYWDNNSDFYRYDYFRLDYNRYDYYRYNTLYWHYNSKAAELNLFVNAKVNATASIMRDSILNKFRYLALHRISVHKKNSDTYRNVYFKYNYDNRRKLTNIIYRDGNYPLQNSVHFFNGVYVTGEYIVPDNTSMRDMPEYSFDYSSKKMTNRYAFSKTDSWGYFRNGEVIISETPSFKIKNADLVNSEAEMLRAIHYPTGGWSELEYENHDYSKVVSDDRLVLINYKGHAGGVRVVSIKDYGVDSTLVKWRRFHYSQNRHKISSPTTSSGILKELPHDSITFCFDGGKKLILKNQGGFFPNVTNLNSPDVGYSCVIEETLDAYGNSLGYVKNIYSNYGTDVNGENHWDEGTLYSVNVNPSSNILPITPYTSKSMERGKLLVREYWDANDSRVKEEYYYYQKTGSDYILSPFQYFVLYGYEWNGHYMSPRSIFLGWMAKTYTYSYFPAKVRILDESQNGRNTYEHSFHYGPHKMLQSDSLLNSDGTKTVNIYTYPFDYDDEPYLQMCTSHYISPKVSSTSVTDFIAKTLTNTYAWTSYNIPYIKKQNTIYRGTVTKKNYEVLTVDPYGNPVEIIENGRHTVLLWSQYGQLLIAHIDNMTLSQLMGASSIDPLAMSLHTKKDVDYNTLRSLRSMFPEALFDIYTYKNDLQLESHESPNGLYTKYLYDDSGRLHKKGYASSYDDQTNSKILNVYDYRYYNNNRQENHVHSW